MVSSVFRVARIVGFAACLASAPMAVQAQSSGLEQVINAPGALADLREQQTALFEKLIAQPDNLDVMFEYATVSIRLEDYEAAISTLERMLIYRQDLSRVRLELAVAYFNLGSYEASKLYFEQVLADQSTPDTVRARIARYMEAIAFRTRKSALSVVANVGMTYATNATLGPESDQVLVNLNGTPTAFNIVNGKEEDDFGVRALVSVSHVYDLQQEDADVWKTDFSAFTVRYFDTTEGNVGFVRLRTGPRLSLDNQQFGPKLRPYVEGQYLNSDNRGLFAAFGVGAEYSNTLTPVLSSFADVGIRYRNFFRSENRDEDAYNFYSAVGLAYIPLRDVVFRGTAIFELDDAKADENSNTEFGLRASAEYQYDSGFEWVDRKWSLSGFGEVRGRFFDGADPAIGLNRKRRDIDFRAGMSHVFTLQQGFGIQLDVDGLFRDSNIVNFDLNNVSSTVSVQYRF